MIADFSGFCLRCDEPIRRTEDVTFRHGGWIHSACHPGGSDEE